MCLNRAGLCKYLNVVFYSPEYCRSQSVPVLNRVSCVRALFTHVCQNATLLCPFIQPRPTAGCARACLHVSFNSACPDVSSYRAVFTICAEFVNARESGDQAETKALVVFRHRSSGRHVRFFVLRFYNPNQSSNSSVHHFL